MDEQRREREDEEGRGERETINNLKSKRQIERRSYSFSLRRRRAHNSSEGNYDTKYHNPHGEREERESEWEGV